MCQVSRFDPWKDPMGVIDAYRLVKEEMPEVQLALVGSMATDDPEGWEFFNSTMAYADGDPDIHILNNLNNVGAIEVNAFQSQADVVIQKSTREGFGLTVSEALWKGRPVHRRRRRRDPAPGPGRRDRLPRLLARRSAPTARCAILREPDLGKQLGRAGKEHVRKHFLTPRLLRDWLRDLHGAAMTQDAALVLVSNRGPATFERAAGSSPPRGGGGLVTALTGLVHHRDAVWVASAMTEEDVEASREHGGGSLRGASSTARATGSGSVESDPDAYDALLQRRRQPDAVVHPALPLGPLERAGHPPPRGRGLRARLLRR